MFMQTLTAGQMKLEIHSEDLNLNLTTNVSVFSQRNSCVNIKLYVHISSLSRKF